MISAKDLYKEYQSGEARCVAINHVDFELERGEFVTVIGASGSGKSSLLHVLSGMKAPTSGEVFYMGKSLSKMKDKQKADYLGREIGFVFQDGNLLGDIPVLQNVALPGYLYQKRKDVDVRAEKWLDVLGIAREKKKYPEEMSGGQRQRAAIARALINQPKILFLDEPTGSLDKAAGEGILQLLVKLNSKGQSIIMVTHDMGAAARGNRVIAIKDGTIYKSLALGKYEGGKLEKRKADIYSILEEGAGK